MTAVLIVVVAVLVAFSIIVLIGHALRRADRGDRS